MHVTAFIHAPTDTSLNPEAVTFTEVRKKKHDGVAYFAAYQGVMLHKTSHYRVTFDCPKCCASNTALLSNFLKKMGKSRAGCTSCCASSTVGTSPTPSKHVPLDKTELLQILPYTSLKTQVDTLGDFDYMPCFGSKKRSEPVIQFKSNHHILRLADCDGRCQCCTALFHMKAFKIRRDLCGRPVLACAECSQTWENKPKRHGDLEYITKFEHKFIKYCEKNEIPLKNGVYVQNKRVAFYLPQTNVYVDVKSNVGWWERMNADGMNTPLHMNTMIENELGGEYIIIYPRTYVSWTRKMKAGLKLSFDVMSSPNENDPNTWIDV